MFEIMFENLLSFFSAFVFPLAIKQRIYFFYFVRGFQKAIPSFFEAKTLGTPPPYIPKERALFLYRHKRSVEIKKMCKANWWNVRSTFTVTIFFKKAAGRIPPTRKAPPPMACSIASIPLLSIRIALFVPHNAIPYRIRFIPADCPSPRGLRTLFLWLNDYTYCTSMQ